jgi:membrane glycosyltransferase
MPEGVGLPDWGPLAQRRRVCFGAGVLGSAAVAAGLFKQALPAATPASLASVMVLLFFLLFGWVSWGAWTAVAGFILLRGSRRSASASRPTGPREKRGRAAIVYPICHEDTERTFAGLEATCLSLAKAAGPGAFDFYVLSDSRDPAVWIEEETAWARLRNATGGECIYYRRRRVPGGGKAENIADFCRRWGRLYEYMVVLDADSVMAGATIVRLVDLMDAHPDVGIIQTVPVPVNRQSLFARIWQFAARLYGPMFAAGMHYWQLGDGVYWGHNAIVRVEPFMAHCGLPRLPGTSQLSGQIMSHDFVEAALIRRAGWTIWLAYDLEGSYEEIPPTIPDYLKRDRRWCRGNLQHARLLALTGLSAGHRLHFLFGICTYLIAPLWMLFLAGEMAVAAANRDPEVWGIAFAAGGPLHGPWAILLLATMAVMLFLPKILALILVAARADVVRLFGGRARCTLSVLLEMLASALMAPIVMVSFSWFVISILAGAQVRWSSQPRRDHAMAWREASLRQAGLTAVGIAWATAAAWIRFPRTAEWLTPILFGLLLSIPITAYSSSAGLGEVARRWRLFLTPEESKPPEVLRRLRRTLKNGLRGRHTAVLLPSDAFARTIVDPYVNAHQVWQMMLQPRDRDEGALTLVQKALEGDPSQLGEEERAALLQDPQGLASLHFAVWTAPEPIARKWWALGLAGGGASQQAPGDVTSS